MIPRDISPAPSELEIDIGASLFNAQDENDPAETRPHTEIHGRNGLVGQELDFMAGEVGSDEDEAIIAGQQSAANRKGTNLKGRTVKKGGGFQAMGLNANLLKAITRKGFSVPTPIQRKTIPLLLKDQDVVGMARTGSGKTAAFVIPMIEKLKTHSTKIGARALLLSPSRELALQTLMVVKELGRGTDLRSILLVGGDSLEEQFSSMANNPDIIIATPGRFLHLMVEMSLDLSSIRYMVFDEADRLFEMGFAAQLTEILHALPASRQTLLFSATLPKSLVEFARAGLQEPTLVRLDADSKISPDLQSAFFTVKSSEKEGALLHILQDVIHIPTQSQLISTAAVDSNKKTGKKRKRTDGGDAESRSSTVSPYSTIIFAATKHHVEYLSQLLRLAGYAVSHVYGSLDQTARKMQVHAFRSGLTNILVVTDVAARGVDIPVLANVINYDFPSQPKIFVHRVGRTARAGQKGFSYSIVKDTDAPYLLDLQLFLGRKLVLGRVSQEQAQLTQDIVVGSLRRDDMQASCEWVTKTIDSDVDLSALRSVALKGEKLYQRTRNPASSESAKRAKDLVSSNSWMELHSLFEGSGNDMEVARENMLARIGGFRPQESIFEITGRRGGRKGQEDAIEELKNIRVGFESKKQKSLAKHAIPAATETSDNGPDDIEDARESEDDRETISMASDSELEVTFGNQKTKQNNQRISDMEDMAHAYRDTDNFMSYHPTNLNLSEEKAYGVQGGTNTNFTEAARGVVMDLGADESSKTFGEARGIMRWDKRHKKYVSRQNDDDGSKGRRLIRGESGAKIAASFRSGRYDAWRKANKMSGRSGIGQTEDTTGRPVGKQYRHKVMKTPKAADKYRDNYEKQKKKVYEAKERTGTGTRGVQELRSVDDIRKQRNLKEKRKEKNARPSKKSRR